MNTFVTNFMLINIYMIISFIVKFIIHMQTYYK